MAGNGLGRRTVGIAVMVALCAALFLVPSAWIAQRHWPRWLSLAVGLLAFPALPVGWHLWSERRRKRSGGKGALTGSDRFLFRLVAVGLVFVAPLFVFDRGNATKGLTRHSTWFLHWGGADRSLPPVGGDVRMLGYVPADAEGIGWLRNIEHLVEGLAKRSDGDDDETREDEDRDDPEAKELLFASRHGELLLIVRGDPAAMEKVDVDEARKALAEQSILGLDQEIVTHRPADDLLVVVTEGWDAAVSERIAGGGAAPDALIALIDSAPKQAFFVGAGIPTEKIGPISVRSATAWATVGDERIDLSATVQTGPGGGALLRTAARARAGKFVDDLPESCREPGAELRDALDIGGSGDTVTFALPLRGELVVSLMFCGLSFE